MRRINTCNILSTNRVHRTRGNVRGIKLMVKLINSATDEESLRFWLFLVRKDMDMLLGNIPNGFDEDYLSKMLKSSSTHAFHYAKLILEVNE